MYDHTMTITADLKKCQQIATNLKSNPPSIADVESDPQAFLSQYGVEIDATTASLIKDRLSNRAPGGVQAAVIHLDT